MTFVQGSLRMADYFIGEPKVKSPFECELPSTTLRKSN